MYFHLGKTDNKMIKRKIDNRIESEMVFCNDNISVKGPVTYFPVYMLMFLKTERFWYAKGYRYVRNRFLRAVGTAKGSLVYQTNEWLFWYIRRAS